MTTTRRLAAILVADVVGYSRLMEADEAGTLEALKERRKGIVEPTLTQPGEAPIETVVMVPEVVHDLFSVGTGVLISLPGVDGIAGRRNAEVVDGLTKGAV